MKADGPDDIQEFLRREFRGRGNIEVLGISVRSYPEETNFIVLVDELDLPAGAAIGNDLDEIISAPGRRAFVVVRKAPPDLVSERSLPLTDGVQDERAAQLMRLISARSRVSEAQPSLSYIKDVELNFSAITAPRHHLIFGRRGAGKTALLVEARRTLSDENSLSCWVNMQTLRNETPERVFLYVMEAVASVVAARQQQIRSDSYISVQAVRIYEQLGTMLSERETDRSDVERLVPRIQQMLKRFLESSGLRLFIFVDDYYYLPRSEQPRILDMLHGCVRDCDAWLKIASIRHLTRWWQHSPPVGLQTGHDADLMDLDVTLQDPAKAKAFLESILQQYARHVGVPALARLFNSKALDRLVLASGAVPRDYLNLARSAIGQAQQRQNAKLVGAQDVNQSAGDAAQVKLQELEEDMAANVVRAERTLDALKILRDFCLEETSHTYFLVSYRDKENYPHNYNVLTNLLDLRLIHIVNPGVSDQHAAGQRAEAYMLDLSQFSGHRLKQNLRVLDFISGHIVTRKTKGASVGGSDRVGDNPLKVIAILRAAPTFTLDRLGGLIPAQA